MPIDLDDLRVFKGGDPEAVRESERRRFADVSKVDVIIENDEKWRALRGAIDNMRKEKGLISKQIPARKKAKEPIDDLLAASKAKTKEIEEADKELKRLEQLVKDLVGQIGNYIHESVPVFEHENDPETGKSNNVVMEEFRADERRVNTVLYDGVTPNPLAETLPQGLPSVQPGGGPNGSLLQHGDVLARLEGVDMVRGTRVAGNRSYFLRGVGVALNYALQQYAMHYLIEREYTLLQPPYFMNQSVMAGVAQLAEFDESLYHVSGSTGADNEETSKYLIATAEQPICAFHKDEWMHEQSLLDKPILYGGISTCFRKEAGNGKDTRGIFRVHQFEKIEQFIICHPTKSWDMFKMMSKQAEMFTQSLGLPYHVINIVSGDLNNAAARKHDLEAWFPFEGAYRELVSCSNCLDYQARAMNIRCGEKTETKRNTDGSIAFEKKKYVHMLNATLCACTRVICCILENFQTPDGVTLPEKLIPFMPPSMLATDEQGRKFIPYTAEYVPPPPEKPAGKKGKGGKKGAGKAKKEKAPKAPKAPAAAMEKLKVSSE